MFKYYLFAAVAALIVAAAIYTFIRNRKIRKNGVETDAVVSRIDESVSASPDTVDVNYIYYVTYVSQDGKTVEARLDSAPGYTRVGEPVRIKYLPEKPNFAVIVKNK